MSELVEERHGPVLVLRLNRPEARNALTPDLLGAVVDAISTAEGDGTRAVVLTGTGDKAFCAGMDLRAGSTGFPPAVVAGFQRLMANEVTVPLIGAANGAAVGGGLELLLGCDLVVAADHAELGLPEVQRGLIPGGSGTALTRRLPYGIAMELLLTGERISAARAAQVALVNAVVAPDDLLPAALGIADRIARNGPLAVAAIKELGRLAGQDQAAWAERLRHWQGVVFGSADAAEGAAAFVERRAPRWTGR